MLSSESNSLSPLVSPDRVFTRHSFGLLSRSLTFESRILQRCPVYLLEGRLAPSADSDCDTPYPSKTCGSGDSEIWTPHPKFIMLCSK
jgi:hypothetical protein